VRGDPLFAGAVHETGSWPFWLDVTDTLEGAAGAAAGVALAAGADAEEFPTALVATTETE
jgi:hypothetical protein